MMLDTSKDFEAMKLDTLALMLLDAQLVFYYGANAAQNALSVMEQSAYGDEEELAHTLVSINDALKIVRDVTPFENTLKSTEIVTHLSGVIGDLADTYASLIGIPTFSAECYTHTTRTVQCPVAMSIVEESYVSDEYDIGRIDPAQSTLVSSVRYLGAPYVASLTRGSVRVDRELGRGRGGQSLTDFAAAYSGTAPFTVKTGGNEHIVSASQTSVISAIVFFMNERDVWAAQHEYVQLPVGRGRTGPLYVWNPKRTAISPTLTVREGDTLVSAPGGTVTGVQGSALTFDVPVKADGDCVFVNRSRETWVNQTQQLRPITLKTSNFTDRTRELASEISLRTAPLERLTKAHHCTRNTYRFDIRSAHHAINADYAYELLENGELFEYVSLDNMQSSSSITLSTAMLKAREGTYL